MMLSERQQSGQGMNGLVYDEEDRLVAWASEIIGFQPRDDVQAMGWQTDGELRAVCLWDCFSHADCNIHIASDGAANWLSRSFLTRAFLHPFAQWEKRRVTALVPSKNHDALRFDLHLGFKQEGLIRHALPDDDIILLGLLREDCRWIPQKYRR
ncbi:putative acyl CoA N-acyltransferase [Erwinia phage Stean]|nr:putative acyl CoA N-acyltransferase [Erwinia phage Stean]